MNFSVFFFFKKNKTTSKKEKHHESSQKKAHITYKAARIHTATSFSPEVLENTRQGNYIVKALKLYTQNLISKT